MTRLERKEAELAKFIEFRAAAYAHNDFLWLHANQKKIQKLEREIAELKAQKSATVFSVLADKDEMVKNGVYKALLTISLMADACNEACEEAKKLLAQHGVADFSFREKVDAMCKMSMEIASIVTNAKNDFLDDFIVYDQEFVEKCMAAASEHLSKTLKL